MKLFDYLTMASLTGGKIPDGLRKLVVDPECEVFALERGSVIVICDTKRMGMENKERYAMCVVEGWGPSVVKTSESKEALMSAYGKLVAKGIVDPNKWSSVLKKDVEEALKR